MADRGVNECLGQIQESLCPLIAEGSAVARESVAGGVSPSLAQLTLDPTGGSEVILIWGAAVGAPGEGFCLRSVRMLMTRPISTPTPKNAKYMSATGP